VSARSRRSGSTIRALPAPASQSHVVSRSRAGSRVATTTIKIPVGAANPPLLQRAGSYTSARRIPLPPSGVGSSRAGWDNDLESVAPSDSISCVGSSRRSSRHYR
jgi:hypothetical protein